jgi:hypothetical protein
MKASLLAIMIVASGFTLVGALVDQPDHAESPWFRVQPLPQRQPDEQPVRR